MHVPGKTIATVELCCCLLLALAISPAFAAQPDPGPKSLDRPVTVHLESGRTLTAQVDGRSDQTTLWLRWSRGSARLLRPVRWDRVRQIQLGDQVISAAELRRRIEASPPAAIPAPPARLTGRIVLNGKGKRPKPPPVEPEAGQETGKVQSLAIEAAVANWNADPDVDGLVVDVYPLDASGRPVAVDGTLEVELYVEGETVPGSVQSFPRRGRWTERVRPGDFLSGGARYRLAFSAVGFRPEEDLKAAPYGTVRATLSVPGQGVYSATANMVRVRPYNAARDAMQAITGHR